MTRGPSVADPGQLAAIALAEAAEEAERRRRAHLVRDLDWGLLADHGLNVQEVLLRELDVTGPGPSSGSLDRQFPGNASA